jgi:BASS family bile acid:Na+ symporter
MVLNPTPSIALGMILIAACPGGNVSNFLTHLARGNTAMSVTMTAVSTVAAVVFTPLNLAVWGSLNPHTATILREIQMETSDLAQTILVILGIPTALGMGCAVLTPTLARKLHKPFKIFAIVAFTSFVAVAFAQNFSVFLNYVGWVALAVLLHNGMALSIGYWTAWFSGLAERDCRAVSIEVGIQNSALGLALVFRYFEGLGGMALVAGWWGIWHIISGLTVATYWSRRPPAGEAHTA